MGMKVVRHLAHLTVNRERITETLLGDAVQNRQRVLDICIGWFGAVMTPHHHGHPARLAVSNPTDLVFVIPVGEAVGLTQLTVWVVLLIRRWAHLSHKLSRQTLSSAARS